MTFHTIEETFWTLVTKQAEQRGQPLTSFGKDVAQTILTGGLLACEDRLKGTPQYRVISAPTGSGKSSYAFALMAALIKAVPGSSALFLCETIDQCEDTYLELIKLIDPVHVGVWTSAHDRRKDMEVVEREHGFAPSARFFAEDLASCPVAVVTHKFHQGPRGQLARDFQGQPRTLTIVDERPKEVSIFDIDQGDVGKARDWAVLKFGDDSPAVEALKALHSFLGEVWETERPGEKNYRALFRPDLSWFSWKEADIIMITEPDSVQGKVVGFAQALAVGYAFMSRYEGSPRGGRFVGYRLELPILPGTMLLDATADIDGVSQLVNWRASVPSPRVSFENLTVTHIAPPEDIVGSRERVSEVVKKAKTATPYAGWIRDTVVANTKTGEKVLVVAHKALLDHEYLPDRDSLGSDAYDLDGRKVAFINWGRGVGSNRWKKASSVFLFGEFHVPKRATVATTLGLLDQPAGSPRLNGMQSPNSQDEVLLSIQHGHLLRWEKQLAIRGNARNLTADGACGRQKLFVTSEFKRFMRHRETLFPGATFVMDPSVQQAAQKQGGGQALAALLATSGTDCLTSIEVKEQTGVSLQKHSARLLADPVVKQAMRHGRWRYVRGRGRGNPSRFMRVTTVHARNDNRQPDRADAA